MPKDPRQTTFNQRQYSNIGFQLADTNETWGLGLSINLYGLRSSGDLGGRGVVVLQCFLSASGTSLNIGQLFN